MQRGCSINLSGAQVLIYNPAPSALADTWIRQNRSKELKRDQKFFDMYSLVIGGLAIFALAIFVLAMKMSDLTQGVYTTDVDEYRDAVNTRLQPVGQVYMPGDELPADAPSVSPVEEAAPVSASLSGAQVYNNACNVCHGNGIGNAPMLTNTADWEPRIAQGAGTLKKHAVDGYAGSVGFMPPKGGNASLSDEEVHAAVDYMIGEAGGN
jgi:cytochrome c5